MAPLCQFRGASVGSSSACITIALSPDTLTSTLSSASSTTLASTTQQHSSPPLPTSLNDTVLDSSLPIRHDLRLVRRKLSDAAQGGITVGAAIAALVLIFVAWRVRRRIIKERMMKRKESSPGLSPVDGRRMSAMAQTPGMSDKELVQRVAQKEREANPRRASHGRSGSDESIGRHYAKPDSRRSSKYLEVTLNPISEVPTSELPMTEVPMTENPTSEVPAAAAASIEDLSSAPSLAVPTPNQDIPEIALPASATNVVSPRLPTSPLRNEVRTPG